MELSDYCRVLLEAKRNFGPLYGKGFIAARLAMAAAAVGMIVYGHQNADGMWLLSGGILLLGYIAGSTLAQVRISRSLQQRWPLQVQLLDWEKIERLAKEPAAPAA